MHTASFFKVIFVILLLYLLRSFGFIFARVAFLFWLFNWVIEAITIFLLYNFLLLLSILNYICHVMFTYDMNNCSALNIIIGNSKFILEFFTHKEKALLIDRYTLLVVNHCLHFLNGITKLDIICRSLAGKSLDCNLYTFRFLFFSLRLLIILHASLSHWCFNCGLHLLILLLNINVILPSSFLF